MLDSTMKRDPRAEKNKARAELSGGTERSQERMRRQRAVCEFWFWVF